MSIDPIVERRHVIEVASDLVEFLAECWDCGVRRPARAVKHLRPGESFPGGFCIEFGALLFLAELERSGLSGLAEPLPSVEDTLDSLKTRLSSDPGSFWAGDARANELFGKIFRRWSAFSWQRFDSANIAVALDESDEFVKAFAELLWNFRHLAPPAVLETDEFVAPQARRSLFDSMPKTKQKRKNKHAGQAKKRSSDLPPS